MSKITIQKNWNFEPLETIAVINNLAPMIVDARAEEQISLEATLQMDDPDEEFDAENYITAEYAEGELKLTFDEYEVMDRRDVRASVLKLSIPKNVTLKVETDNYPMSFSGMENKLKLTSENAPVSIHNSTGDMHIESENGPVRLHQCQGNLYAKMENGPLSAEAITGESVHLHSENGPIKLRLASYSKVEVETENGQIYYETQPVENGDFTFKTENGIIHLVFPVNFDFELKATTESGRVKSQLNVPLTLEDDTYTMVNGDGSTKINISTENGSIKLSNDGHINIDYAKEKIEQLKEALRNANSP